MQIVFAWGKGGFDADADTFGGDSFEATCRDARDDGSGSYGNGATATVSGTWSSASCGDGRLAGRMTIDAYSPIRVDFDVSTTAGIGSAAAVAANDEGRHGTGEVALAETLSQETCPQPAVAPTTDDLGVAWVMTGFGPAEPPPAVAASGRVQIDRAPAAPWRRARSVG